MDTYRSASGVVGRDTTIQRLVVGGETFQKIQESTPVGAGGEYCPFDVPRLTQFDDPVMLRD